MAAMFFLTLPLQDVVPWRVTQYRREMSVSSGYGRAAHRGRPEEAGELTQMRCPGTKSRAQRL